MPRGDNFRKKPAPVAPDVLAALRTDTVGEEAVRRELSYRRMEEYQPYAKQAAFHAAGATKRERLLMAGNQLGKTFSGAYEAACHLTGIYPDWWQGRRFKDAIAAWAGSDTSFTTRDGVQRLLLGRPGDPAALGTGMIPKRLIVGDPTSSRSAPNAVDTVVIKHVSGRNSTLTFKSYEMGREKWQGETLHFVWFDEEPPMEIYMEGLTRTNTTGGITWMTFTPLNGMSEVVGMFYPEPETPSRHVTNMTIEDVDHLTAAEKAEIIASYPLHERDARTRGIPILGSGRVFAEVAETDLAVPAFAVPSHWPQIGGMDFGWGHPFAAVNLAWDRDADTIYVLKTYRKSEATPMVHAGALKPWGDWLPWAWPHDGLQHDKGSGEQLAKQYRAHGLKMLPNRATFDDGSSGVEAGVFDILTRMQTGRFKVFNHLGEWFEEFRLYHRKDGQIVKKRDDLMSATRYAVMMLRYATVHRKTSRPWRRDIPGLAMNPRT